MMQQSKRKLSESAACRTSGAFPVLPGAALGRLGGQVNVGSGGREGERETTWRPQVDGTGGTSVAWRSSDYDSLSRNELRSMWGRRR